MPETSTIKEPQKRQVAAITSAAAAAIVTSHLPLEMLLCACESFSHEIEREEARSKTPIHLPVLGLGDM